MRSSLCDPARLLPVTVHRLADEHLPRLTRGLDRAYADYYRARLPRQRENRGFTLLALAGVEPVGGVFVGRDPPDEYEVRAELPGVPMLYKAHVPAAYQRRCVGTQLLAGVHESLRRLGYDRVALGVDTLNHGAIRLYERLGYARWTRRTYGTGADRYRIMLLDLITGDRTWCRPHHLCACVLADVGRCPGRAA